MIKVSGLFCYPIKSCKGHALQTAMLDARGIADDRLMMFVDDSGVFLTQRELPKLALIEPMLHVEFLQLRAPMMPPLDVRVRHEGTRRNVVIWRNTCASVDQGDAVAQWASQFLDKSVRLVRMADEHVRTCNPEYARRPEDQLGFADGYPLLLISRASLDDLNTRLDAPMLMNRFRPNIVIEGCAPFAEDMWDDIRIGEVPMAIVKPCARCVMTTVNQANAEKGVEPLHTLASYRTTHQKIMFGQNVTHFARGVISVGDKLVVTQTRPDGSDVWRAPLETH